MPMTGEQLIAQSLEMWNRQNDRARQEFYDRLADHAESDLKGKTYFPQAFAESDARYEKRPKEVLPLGASALEVLAGHMMGDGVSVTIGEPDSKEDKLYREVEQVNDLDGEHALALAQVAGTFGWLVDIIRPNVDKVTSAEQIEFEYVDPRGFRAHYNAARVGGSRKLIDGISFATLYDASSGEIMPVDQPIGSDALPKKRVEIITEGQWAVYLDGEMTPADPGTGVLWQPNEEGSNPFGVVTAVPLWNVHQTGAMEGKSDIDPAYKLAEQINRSYSQILNNIDHYFPTLTAGTRDETVLTQGIGMALVHDPDSAPPGYIIPNFDVEVLLKPFRTQLNLFFSLAHTPASSHGLGAVFGEAKAAESGRAKFYEFARLERHVARKRANFEAFKRAQWRTLARFINNGTGIGNVDENATVNVEWATDIVPVSEEERIDRIVAEMKAGIKSRLEAVMEARNIDRDSAQEVVDDIGVQAGRAAPRDRLESELEAALTEDEE